MYYYLSYKYINKIHTQTIYQHILTSEFFTYHMIGEHYVIQTNRWASPVFQTLVGSPANFKTELTTLRKA